MTTIELNDEEAQLFILFRQYQDKIKFLIEHGALDICSGQAILHFNQHSKLLVVEKLQKYRT